MEFKKEIVTLEKGEVEITEPSGGNRNAALIAADTGTENPKRSIFMTTLLPLCITKHPFGNVKIEHAVNSLHYKEYDLLMAALNKLVKDTELETKK